MQNNFHYMFKYIIIGDPSVGKSCLLLQFTEDRFINNYEATLGVQFGSKSFVLRNKIIKAMVWDTAGQQTFKSIIRSYYRGAIIALVVYDITNRLSFNNITKWLEEVQNYSHQHVQIAIIGNKNDLDDARQVPFLQGKKYADQHGYLFFEVSAKQNKFVKQSFERPAQLVVQKLERKQIVLAPGLNIGIKIGNPDSQIVQQYTQNKPVPTKPSRPNRQRKSQSCC